MEICAQNANSALKIKILCSKIEIVHAQMPILHPKTILNRLPWILPSENVNSVLKYKIEILGSENANLGFKTAMVL